MIITKQQESFNNLHLGFISCDLNDPKTIGEVYNGEVIVGIQPFVLLRRFRNSGERLFYKVRVLSNYALMRREVACTQIEILEEINVNEHYLNNEVNSADESIFFAYKKQDLSFFKENKDKVSWSDISKLPYITDDFIDEFNELINFTMISYYYPKLTLELYKKYSELMDIELVKRNEFISAEVKKEILDYIDEERKRKMFSLK